MTGEQEPVTPDETILRLIWEFHYKPTNPIPIRYEAFEPKRNETTGISVFRLAHLRSPDHARQAIAEQNRGRYAIVVLPVAEVLTLGLTIRPDPIADVPGHAVIPELSIQQYQADKVRLKEVAKALAIIASRNIIRTPTDSGA